MQDASLLLTDDLLSDLFVVYLGDTEDSQAASYVSTRWNSVIKKGWSSDFLLARSYVQILNEQLVLGLFGAEEKTVVCKIKEISSTATVAMESLKSDRFITFNPLNKAHFSSGKQLKINLFKMNDLGELKKIPPKDTFPQMTIVHIPSEKQRLDLSGTEDTTAKVPLSEIISSVCKLKKMYVAIAITLSDQEKSNFTQELQSRRLGMPKSFIGLSASDGDNQVLQKMADKLQKRASDFLKKSDPNNAIASAKRIPIELTRSDSLKEISDELTETARLIASYSQEDAVVFATQVSDDAIQALLLEEVTKSFQSMKLDDTVDVALQKLYGHEREESAVAEAFYFNNKADAGMYPQASLPIRDLAAYAENNRDTIRKLLLQIRSDSKTRGLFTYSTNRVMELDANHIQIDDSVNFILAAEPRGFDKVYLFYQMILEKDCSLWFTLNECATNRFWSDDNLRMVSHGNDWKLSRLTSEKITNAYVDSPKQPAFLTKTVLLAKRGEESRKITHYHYEGWSDNEAAPCDHLLLMCAELASDHMCDTGMPVGINCYAGIGRTGELANIIYGIQHIRSELLHKNIDDISINLAACNYKLRMQRGSLVSRREQFVQVWDVVGLYAQNAYEMARKKEILNLEIGTK